MPYSTANHSFDIALPPDSLLVVINVIEYCFCLALQLPSLLLFSAIAISVPLRTKNGSVWTSLSPSLIFYLNFLLIGLISAVVYHCYMISNFVQNGPGKADQYWMFWMALCYECANVAVPIAIFALTIDRCLTIIFPLSYGKRAKRALLVVDVILSFSMFLVSLHIYVMELPLDPVQLSNLCMNASCIKTRQRNLYRLGTKSLLGLINIVASSVFVTLLKTNKILVQNSTAQQKALRNRMVAIILFCETVFNILPNMVAFFANILFNTILSKYAGWITMVGYSLDSFVMSIFYSATLFGRQQRASVGKNIAKVAPANQQIKTVHGHYGRAE
uniref:G-protein coupled receptors family 1 profile domain-containing protein n=1 Tax=Globodera rostochiensis TaxID=31243 RepID=A0A914H7H3_GLORO